MTPTPRQRRGYVAMVIVLGLGWGMTQPLGKLATTSGHGPFALIFWQLVICVLVLGALSLLRGGVGRGGGWRGALARPALRFYAVVAVLGTLVPNATFYISAARLPSGIMSIIISAVPLLAFPIGLALRSEPFTWGRMAGLLLGLGAVALIAAPGASLPAEAMAYLPLALLGPLFYAAEATYVARYGMAGLDPVQAMLGASVVALLASTPIAIWEGDFISPFVPWGWPEVGLVGCSAIHALMYAGYVWLAQRTGAVFAAQSSYITTASGVIWAMLFLGERFSPLIFAAMALLLVGVALVRPHGRDAAGAT